MIVLAPRLSSGRPILPVAAAIALCLSGLPAFGQTDPQLPGLPDGLAAPEGTPVGPSRVREDGIDARRFQPDPVVPDSFLPGVEPRDGRAPRQPANGYEFNAPSVDPAAPLGPGALPGTRLAPGFGGGLGGFDPGGFNPDDSPVLLGVSGTDTASGVVVTQVVPGTPADRAGLERGDRVLTVSGVQVGLVSAPTGPRVVPLGLALARRLRPTGDATLLVQDHRTGRITTINVRPVQRFGPTNPPGYGPGYNPGYGGGGLGYGSQFGGRGDFFDGRSPAASPSNPGLYDQSNPYGANRYDPSRTDPFGRPRR
jgi:hypothetical protein